MRGQRGLNVVAGGDPRQILQVGVHIVGCDRSGYGVDATVRPEPARVSIPPRCRPGNGDGGPVGFIVLVEVVVVVAFGTSPPEIRRPTPSTTRGCRPLHPQRLSGVGGEDMVVRADRQNLPRVAVVHGDIAFS